MENPTNKSTNPTFVVRLHQIDEEHAVESVRKFIVGQQESGIAVEDQFDTVVVTGNTKAFFSAPHVFDVEVEFHPCADEDFLRTRFTAMNFIAHDVVPARWGGKGGC